MEETRKFVCRFCNKRFPSGKSLGGHIRTHMNQQHSRNRAIAGSRKRKKKRDLLSSSEDYYGLREKIPRNTKRSVHNHPFFTLHHHNKKFCRECGKGFSSLKALCGHMACHSTSEKVEKQKFSAMMDYAQSDTETSDPEDLKRTSFVTLNKSNNNPTCSSVSEAEQEVRVEEVATCLMLLSKGFYSHKGRFDLDEESTNSDKDSAIVEAKAKSHSADARIGINDCLNKVKNSVYGNVSDEIVKEVGKDKKMEFSDSRYSRYGSKMGDSKVSIHGVLRNDVSNNQPKMEDGYGFKDYDDVFDEPSKMQMMNSNRSRNNESKKLDKFDDSFNCAKQEYVGKNLDYQVPCKKKKKTSFPNHEVYKKKDSYGSESSSYASAEKSTDSTDSDSFPCSFKKPNKNSKKTKNQVMKKSKKTKEHECPICYKTFGSGQALGGHKRSHFVGGGFEENTINIGMVQQESSPSSPPPSLSPAVVPCLIDLNLPAAADE